MKNLGLNKKPREGIPTPVLIIPQGVLFGREELAYDCSENDAKIYHSKPLQPQMPTNRTYQLGSSSECMWTRVYNSNCTAPWTCNRMVDPNLQWWNRRRFSHRRSYTLASKLSQLADSLVLHCGSHSIPASSEAQAWLSLDQVAQRLMWSCQLQRICV